MTVQLADYGIAYSLQLNNRCLRYLADCEVRGHAVIGVEVDTIRPDVSVYAESLLTRDSRRLDSMWDLFRSSIVRDAAVSRHLSDMRRTAAMLTGGPAQKRLALRLASIAGEEEEAQALVKIVRTLPDNRELTWDSLNELFLLDSSYWRDSARFGDIADAALIKRLVRNYRRGYRANAGYNDLEMDRQGRWLNKHAPDWLGHAQHAVHQLELLRPRLSDKGKAQLWYLEKLADTLRTRVGLIELQRQIKRADVEKVVRKTAERFIDQQVLKMDRRLDRLMRSSYRSKPKRMLSLVEQAVSGAGFERVALFAVPRPGRDEALRAVTEPAVTDKAVKDKEGVG